MTNEIRFESAGLTDRGSVRTDNQDQFFVAQLARSMQAVSSSLSIEQGGQLIGGNLSQLLMVADGMGGHRAGADASRLAVEYFVASILNRLGWLFPKSDGDELAMIEDLKAMLSQSHREIERLSQQDPELTGMGTTFTMAYVIWPKMYIIHAGDSRCYLFRKGRLQLLTRDHTLMERSNILTNALGAGSHEVHAEIRIESLEEGDLVLLCSDGLNKHVDDLLIRTTILENPDPQIVCRSLVDHANSGGGTDNITLVAARWVRAIGIDSMPIYQSIRGDASLFREIAYPPEDTETADIETIHLSSYDLRDYPTEGLTEGLDDEDED